LGKSRVSITESLSLVAMPEEVRSLCRLADITAKSTLLQIVRQGDPKKMIALVERVAAGGGTRQAVRAETAKASSGRPKPSVFAFRPPSTPLHMNLSYSKSKVGKSEIIEALEGILKELRAGRG